MEGDAALLEQFAGKRLIFAVLANKDEDVLAAQLDNIRFYNPDAAILLYNGGSDPNFAQNLNVLQFPYSHPIVYGNLTPYFWEIMKWLDDIQMEYDYLINLDHDVLFVKPGFDTFLDESMAEWDCMGWGINNPIDNPDSTPILSMSPEWHLWQPVFRTDTYLRVFNPAQVYRRELVSRMLRHADRVIWDELINNSQVFALEEVFFVTLAMACGGRVREYPDGHLYNESVRGVGTISIPEAELTRQHPSYYWVHPVKGQDLIDMKNWLQPIALPAKRRRRTLKLRRRLLVKKRAVKGKPRIHRKRIKRILKARKPRKPRNRMKKKQMKRPLH